MHHPTTLRNRGPIVEVLRAFVSQKPGHALEIASGSGGHLEAFAPAFPNLRWHPSDKIVAHEERAFEKTGKLTSVNDIPDELATLDKIGSQFPNVAPAVHLDLMGLVHDWHPSVLALKGGFSLVHAGNLLHFLGRQGVSNLVNAAGLLLQPGGLLTIYGPFKLNGGFEGVKSNEAFDQSLKSMNPAFGLIDVNDVVSLGATAGLSKLDVVSMPANNKLIVLVKELRQKL